MNKIPIGSKLIPIIAGKKIIKDACIVTDYNGEVNQYCVVVHIKTGQFWRHLEHNWLRENHEVLTTELSSILYG